ncbi:transmembrane protein 41B-like isoform X1 [Macrosteles quadrilineatus]|uniref:transmembrane protein 41B-like isoform X1 n=1 Tax=Macrosteles quadrilineatus TaxID=74068 RepID=UPI0023E271AA|nr:transmembrane protein 41B-like isoform X1 [Macrosteles quadrilineatus]XP_054269045.1 transmembrane protein 41B-like isoform X1 [Macrosteles quadrilineatus]
MKHIYFRLCECSCSFSVNFSMQKRGVKLSKQRFVNTVSKLSEISISSSVNTCQNSQARQHLEFNDKAESQLNVSDSVSTRTAVLIITAIFLSSILTLTYIYFSFPELEPEERKYIKLPWDVEEAKQLGRVLEKHKDRNYYEVLAAVVVTYIFLQTFAIPGSISLSILSGFLFPFPLALTLVCFCSATGASFCYLLSHLAGRRLVYKYFPDRAVQYSQTVQKHRRNIFNYILFLRITPFLPNWFINIAAPIVNVPILPFWFGTFLGVAPPSFVAIQAGQTLQQLTSMSGTWSWTSVTWLAVFSLLSLLPVLLRDRLRTKFD